MGLALPLDHNARALYVLTYQAIEQLSIMFLNWSMFTELSSRGTMVLLGLLLIIVAGEAGDGSRYTVPNTWSTSKLQKAFPEEH